MNVSVPLFRRQSVLLAAVLLGGVVLGVGLTTVWDRDPAAADPSDPRGEVAHAEGTDADGPLRIGKAAQQHAGMRVIKVTRSRLPVTVEATGVVAPVPSRVAHLRPIAQGVIDRIDVGVGDRVRAGQPLVQYDNIALGRLIGEYRSARAALRQTEADLQVRRRYFERAEQLIEIEAIAQQTLELRRAEYENAQAAVASAHAQVAQVEEQIHRFGLTDADLAKAVPQYPNESGQSDALHREASHTLIRAPFDGIVTAYDVAVGEMVEPQRELLTITDLSTVWVLADVYEEDLGRVGTGAETAIRTQAYPDRTFIGQLTYISDVIEPSTRTARVRSVLKNPDGALKQDMFVTVSIPTIEAREALAVPVSAVQQIDGQSVVFAQTGSTSFQRRDVRLGVTAADRVEILAGLQPGERIVSEGSLYLKAALLQERIGTER